MAPIAQIRKKQRKSIQPANAKGEPPLEVLQQEKKDQLVEAVLSTPRHRLKQVANTKAGQKSQVPCDGNIDEGLGPARRRYIQTQRTWRHYFVSNMKKYLEGKEPELIDRLLIRPEKLYPYQGGTSEEQLLMLINNNVKKLGSQHWSINISSVIRSLEMCNAPCPGC